MGIQRIVDRSHPELEPYLTLRRPEYARRRGLMVTQGEKNVTRLLRSQFQVRSLLATERWLAELEPFWRPRVGQTQILVGERELLREIIGYRMYQDVMAVGVVPESPDLATVMMTVERPYLFVAFDGLANAENIGVAIRNCGAFGVQAILVDHSSCSPFLRRASRCAMGALFKIPTLENRSLESDFQQLRRSNVQIVAAMCDPESRPIHEVDLTRDTLLVLGSEGEGLRQHLVDQSDIRAYIPMSDETDSVNVASATAALLYETARQRDFPS